MENLLQDLRYGFRLLWKTPTFTVIAVLALGLGIGANTAIFSIVNAVLLRPLPYHDPEQLVQIWDNFRQLKLEKIWISIPEYVDYGKQTSLFSQTAAYDTWDINVATGGSAPERVKGILATASLFPMLGVNADVGRVFNEEEDKPGSNQVVVLSHGYWQRRFGGDRGVVGKTLNFDGKSYNVIGVMPAGFSFPDKDTEVWVPIAFEPSMFAETERGSRYINMVARLKPGVTLEQARTEIDTVASRLQQQYPQSYAANSGWGVSVVSLHEQVVGDIRKPLMILLGAVVFVLLIACANVANLLLVRAAVRQKETALRTALGASRGRLIRQLLTESVVLSLAGGALGLLLAYLGVNLILAASPEDILPIKEVGLDGWVLGFTLLVSLLTGVIFGLAPALQASKTDLNEVLKEGGRSTVGGKRQRTRNALVVLEVAMSLLLLVGAGLMIRSFLQLLRVDPGFKAENVLTMQLSLPQTKYTLPPQRAAFYRQVLQRLETVPGVRAVGAINQLPLTGSSSDRSFNVEGRPPQNPPPNAEFRVVSPSYFRAITIPLVKGRYLADSDQETSPKAVIINQTMARRYWPNEDPMGKRISFDGTPTQQNWREVVGIVGDVRQLGLGSDAKPEMYVPFTQFPRANMTLVVQTAGDPANVTSAVRGEVRAIDGDLPVYNARTMEQVLSQSVARQRLNMLLLGIFASVALALAAIGIYGVMSYTTAQRMHEFGIRTALGARPKDLLRLVLGQGMILALIGVGIGLVAAFVITRIMSSLLYNVSATDPVTFLGIAVLLLLVALAACLVPARKATRVDPMIALRYQ
jgi:predicted permease